MPRPSKIDRLPAEIRELIGELRRDGRFIDEILAKLRELKVDVGRSALAEHVQELDAIAEVMKRSRGYSEAIMERFGEEPDNRTARLNRELMHAMMTRLIMAGQGEEGVAFDPREAMFLATALEKLGKAGLADTTAILKLRKEMATKAADEAVAAAEAEGAKHGAKLPPEALRAIREQVYGIVDR